MKPLTYAESLASALPFKPRKSYPSHPQGAFESLALRIGQILGQKPRFGCGNGCAARPDPAFTIAMRERMAVTWLEKAAPFIRDSALQGEVQAALAIAGQGTGGKVKRKRLYS